MQGEAVRDILARIPEIIETGFGNQKFDLALRCIKRARSFAVRV